MADHDGHTTNVGPVTVGIDTDRIRNRVLCNADVPCGKLTMGQVWHDVEPLALCDEVDRLRAENAALAAALEDIAGMWQRPDGAWVATAECSHLTAFTCIEKHPDDPGEWCPVCVAEVAWCAWKMGVLA